MTFRKSGVLKCWPYWRHEMDIVLWERDEEGWKSEPMEIPAEVIKQEEKE